MNDQMKEKLEAVAELLGKLAGVVAEIAAGYDNDVKKESPHAPMEKAPALEDVRAVLADISRKGKTAEMKALLGKFGASKLSEVKQEDYKALLAAAKEVSDA